MIHCTHRIDYDLLLHIQTSNPVHLERCSTIISSASLDNYPSINLTIEKLKLLMNLILGKLKRTPTEASIQKTVVFGDCFGSIYEGSEVSRNRQHWQFRQYRGSIGHWQYQQYRQYRQYLEDYTFGSDVVEPGARLRDRVPHTLHNVQWTCSCSTSLHLNL